MASSVNKEEKHSKALPFSWILWGPTLTNAHKCLHTHVHEILFAGSNLKNVAKNFSNINKANVGAPHPHFMISLH